MKPILLSFFFISNLTFAADDNEKIKLQGLSITGDKELPKVLYIVPWESHKATKITAPKFKSTLDEPFEYIQKPQ